MFVILPIGHDRPVYDRPWLTIGLIVTCAGLFLASWLVEQSATRDMMAAANRIDAISSRYPAARVSFTVDGVPDGIDAPIQALVDPDPGRAHVEGDAELEAAMLDLVSAMNRQPVLRFGYRPAHPTVLGAIGHAFMHAGLFHLLGNMLFLWVAGGVLECFWRRWAYVLLYVASGAAGVLAYHLSAPGSTTPMVGASGAIAGLIGAFVVSYPRSRIRIGYFAWILRFFVGSFLVPAWIVIPLWGLSELAQALLGANEGVANWAHVGGFACGIVAGGIGRVMGWIAVDAGYDHGPPPVVASVFPPPAPRAPAPPGDLPLPDLSDLPPPPRVPPERPGP